MDAEEDWLVGIGIELPLFTGFSRVHELRRSKAELLKTEEETRELVQEVQEEVWTIYSRLRETYDTVQTTEVLLQDAAHGYRRPWDKRRVTRSFRRHTERVQAVAYDGSNRLATGSLDGEVCIWKLDEGDENKLLVRSFIAARDCLNASLLPSNGAVMRGVDACADPQRFWRDRQLRRLPAGAPATRPGVHTGDPGDSSDRSENSIMRT